MEIIEQAFIEKFTVAAGVNMNFGEKVLETLTLRLGNTEVKLNKEECNELLNVVNGKCHRIVAFDNKEDYSPHSALCVSTHGKERGELPIYTTESIAKF